MRPVIAAAACAALVAACSPGKPESAAGAPGAKFNTDIPMTEFMGHVVDPAAFLYWNNSGYEITEAGERDRYPTTDEGWDVLVTGATTLVEAGNMMQLPHRVREPAAEWNKYAQMMSERALAALAAAEKHDKQAVFDEGGRLYQACVGCHEKFIVEPAEAAGEGEAAAALPGLPAPSGK